MKLVSFYNAQGGISAGALEGEEVIDLNATDSRLPRSVKEILTLGLLDDAAAAAKSSTAVKVSNPRLAAPLPDPGNIICIGLNYRDHAIESKMDIPTEPVIFGKFSSSIIGSEEPIILPASSQEVDYEAELVAVIGRRARNVSAADAMGYVAGYTAGHDVSARDWQLRKPGGQWILGKSFESFAPIGPSIVTADEIRDPHNLAIEFRLNGERMQSSNTRQLIFQIDFLISYLSQLFPLQPGDLIFTGTPPGVGFARKPPVFLQDGDVCEVKIEGLDVLRNSCVRR